MTREELLALCDCENCPINRAGLRNPVLGSGPDQAQLVIVGEGPGRDEVRTGRPFTGPSGQILDKTLTEVNLSRSEIYTTNATLCYVNKNETGWQQIPQAAVRACRPRLIEELKQQPTKVVMALGATSAQSLLDDHSKTIGQVQGAMQWREDLQRFVLPTYHPAAILRGGGGREGLSEGLYEHFYNDMDRAARLARGEMPLPDPYEEIPVEHITTEAKALRALDTIRRLPKDEPLAIDVETDGFNARKDALLQVAIGTAAMGWVFEAETLVGTKAGVELVKGFNSDRTWVLHNLAFDNQFLQHHFGCVPRHEVDTMCLGLGLTEHGTGVGLKTLSRQWLNAPHYEDELKPFLPTKATPFSAVPRPILAKYAGKDVVYTARLYPILTQLAKEEGTYHLSTGLLVQAQQAFANISYNGVHIDLEYAEQLRQEFEPKLAEVEAEIQQIAREYGYRQYKEVTVKHERFEERESTRTLKDGTVKVRKLKPKRVIEREKQQVEVPFNPGSTTQLEHLLYDLMGFVPVIKDGKRKTGEEFRNAHGDAPIAQLLGRRAKIKKMLSTYVDGISRTVDDDGLAHPDFRIADTVTGRLTIKNPPLQVIPRSDTVGDEFGSIKALFKPTEGHVFVDADYSQLELRVGAVLSGDENMKAAILSGDFHRMTAARVFNKPIDEVTSVERWKTKFITFGIMYGRGAKSLAEGELEGNSIEECQEYIRNWFRQFPRYHTWWLAQQREAVDGSGRLTTKFGRVRRFRIADEHTLHRIKAQAVNFPIQSTASDITLNSLIELERQLPRLGLGRVLFTVHDAILCEVPRARVDEAASFIRDTMEGTWTRLFGETPFVPFEAAVELGPHWGAVEEWDPEGLRRGESQGKHGHRPKDNDHDAMNSDPYAKRRRQQLLQQIQA